MSEEGREAAGAAALTRRSVLCAGAAIGAVSALSSQAEAAATPGTVLAQDPLSRAAAARDMRIAAAQHNFASAPTQLQPINADEATYADYRGNFSKTLRHNSVGEVDPASYQSLLDALASRNPADFEAILMGRPSDPARVRLVSPQAAFAFELSGQDGNAARLPAAPRFASATTEAEMAELYWYALTRDIAFIDYDSHPDIAAAAADLNSFSARAIFPMIGGAVTPQSVFRARIFTLGSPPGALVGPFVSQFLLQPFAVGQLVVNQSYPRLKRLGRNQFMTSFAEALAIQNGAAPSGATQFENRRSYIRCMRDLSEWVHRDFPLQSGLHAFAVALGFNDPAVFDPALPYLQSNSATQDGFVDFGAPDISHLVSHAPRQALTGAWFQKWCAHRRLRPEAYAIRVNVQTRRLRSYGIAGELVGSQAFARIADEVRKVNGARNDPSNDGLLPMGFPEGSPAHPAYPGGHSSFVAAAATVLKAFLDEDYVIPNPVQADRNGNQLVAWKGAALTIGGELNKLVANVTHARDAAGMHWRSDGVGNLIGEAVAIALLRDYSVTYNEQMDGLTLRKFNGQKIRIRDGVVSNIAG
jgi:hypothetical protein